MKKVLFSLLFLAGLHLPFFALAFDCSPKPVCDNIKACFIRYVAFATPIEIPTPEGTITAYLFAPENGWKTILNPEDNGDSSIACWSTRRRMMPAVEILRICSENGLEPAKKELLGALPKDFRKFLPQGDDWHFGEVWALGSFEIGYSASRKQPQAEFPVLNYDGVIWSYEDPMASDDLFLAVKRQTKT